ncbi:MAG TPA: hypothetical protein VIJ90_01140 [Gemmatimonadaceae bacterium]
MRTRILAAALAACIPAAVFAQGKGARSSDTASSSSSRASYAPSSARSPTSHDLADLNPAALLISKRKKVPLADSTVAQLKAVEKKINDRNVQFFATYDSVRKWTMPIGDNSTTQGHGLRGGVADSKLMAPAISPTEQAKMQSSMRDLRALMADYRERRKPDVTDALGVIPDAQKKAATDLLAQQDGDLEKLIGGRP